MKIFYFPLEPYKERYTVQLSAANTGWLEHRWLENNIDYVRIEGQHLSDKNKNTINVGQVLDSNKRGHWSCSQIMNFLKLYNDGIVKNDDVLYFDDFWHPGISALPYTFQQTNIKPKMFAMLHAQSIDQYDFCYPMRHWMRPFEIGIGKILSGIFVTSTCLKDLCLYHNVGNEDNVFIAGLPFNSNQVKTFWPTKIIHRKRQVIYSSRWDKEKRPDIFLRICEETWKKDITIKFIVTTSAKEIRSNNPQLIKMLRIFQKLHSHHFEVREGQTKTEYYTNLLQSSIQINTADQDFVSWTLLEASLAGCRPLYPHFLSFPEVLNNNADLMYNKNDAKEASDKIIKFINNPPEKWNDIWQKFDSAWFRMYQTMKGEKIENLYNN